MTDTPLVETCLRVRRRVIPYRGLTRQSENCKDAEMSNRKSPEALEMYRERRVAERVRSFEMRTARQSKRAERVAFGGAW